MTRKSTSKPKEVVKSKEGSKAKEGSSVWKIITIIIIIAFIIIGSVYGIVYFVADNAITNVQSAQDDLEKNLEKIGTSISGIKRDIENKINELKDEEERNAEKKTFTDVNLYYYKAEADTDESGNILCNADSVLPVKRSIKISGAPIYETIDLLIQGELSKQEREDGFSTEFPLDGFFLKSANFSDGDVVLEFSDEDRVTSSGSCRVQILKSQIEKTALQFESVSSITILPEELFQP